jgi:hypothetical protein
LLLTPRARRIVTGIEITPHSAIPCTTASSRITVGVIASSSTRTANAITRGLLLACAWLSVAA